MSIQRYGFNAMCDGESGRCLEDMVKDDDGDYVLYADHAAVVERLNAEAETLFHNYSHMVKQRNKLDDEVERLRAALHKIAYLQHEIDSPPLISEAEAMRIAAREALHASRGES